MREIKCFENSTKVAFGKGCVKEFLGGKVLEYGKNVLLAYGTSLIKKNGICDGVVNILPEIASSCNASTGS